MHIIENPVKNSTPLLPDIPYMSGLKAAVLDIETTGLSPEKSILFLIGVLSQENDNLKITQFLASSPDEEIAVLSAFFEFAKNFDIFLNYNGTAFDIPFINKRSRKVGLERSIEACRSVDYMKIFKTSYLTELLPNLKLKTVEQYAGVLRNDTISGKECISLYHDYVNNKDKNSAKTILLHNYEDLSCFPRLNKLILKIDFHTAFGHMGFPVKSDNFVFFVCSVKQLTASIRATGLVPDCSLDCAYYETEFNLIIDSTKKTFFLEIFKKPHSPEDYANIRLVNLHIMRILSEIRF